jgi:hypothetical protein
MSLCLFCAASACAFAALRFFFPSEVATAAETAVAAMADATMATAGGMIYSPSLFELLAIGVVAVNESLSPQDDTIVKLFVNEIVDDIGPVPLQIEVTPFDETMAETSIFWGDVKNVAKRENAFFKVEMMLEEKDSVADELAFDARRVRFDAVAVLQ